MLNETSWTQCADLLIRGGQRLFDEWTATPEAKAEVMSFVHRRFHQISLAELEGVRSAHAKAPNDEKALADVDPKEAIREVEDFHPNYPLALLFHGYLEETGKVPTFLEYREYAWKGPHKAKCWEAFERHVQRLTQYSNEAKRRALRWRFGNAYSSSFRELYAAAWLREKAGLHTHYHLFADIQLQVDLWAGDRLICLRVPRGQYLERKRKIEDWARQFRIYVIDVPHQGRGKLWIPVGEQLRRVVIEHPAAGVPLTISEPAKW